MYQFLAELVTRRLAEEREEDLLSISEKQFDTVSCQLVASEMQFSHLGQTPLAVLWRQQQVTRAIAG
jgi:hypothetical protein